MPVVSFLDEIWLLTTYSKNEKVTIKGHILKKIAEEIFDVQMLNTLIAAACHLVH
jgi:uncharacterized protein YdeI (BOF family)